VALIGKVRLNTPNTPGHEVDAVTRQRMVWLAADVVMESTMHVRVAGVGLVVGVGVGIGVAIRTSINQRYNNPMGELKLLPPPVDVGEVDGPVITLPALPSVTPTPTPRSIATVRPLTMEEIDRIVAPEFAARGNQLPDPAQSIFFGVVRDGHPTGSFITLQLRLHADPVLLVEGDQAALGMLVQAVKQHVVQHLEVADVYVFTPPGNTQELARLFDMQPEPWTVFAKRVDATDLKKELPQ